jgi:hypothetical protein
MNQTAHISLQLLIMSKSNNQKAKTRPMRQSLSAPASIYLPNAPVYPERLNRLSGLSRASQLPPNRVAAAGRGGSSVNSKTPQHLNSQKTRFSQTNHISHWFQQFRQKILSPNNRKSGGKAQKRVTGQVGAARPAESISKTDLRLWPAVAKTGVEEQEERE